MADRSGVPRATSTLRDGVPDHGKGTAEERLVDEQGVRSSPASVGEVERQSAQLQAALRLRGRAG